MSSTGWMLVLASLMQGESSPVAIDRIEPNPAKSQSLAVRVDGGSLVHTGQLFPDGPRFAPTPPTDQVFQLFSQLRELLKSADATFSDVVKLNVYVNHPAITAMVERELSSRFPDGEGPAVSFVETLLPDASTVVALDAVARSHRANITTATLLPSPDNNEPARAAILPAGGVSYISGQAERGDGTLADATTRTMQSLFKTLDFLKTSPSRVVHVKAFLNPMTDVATARAEIVKSFGDVPCPPLSCVEWRSSLPIEIEMVVATDILPATDGPPPPIEYLTPPGMTSSPVYCRIAKVNVPQRIYVAGLYGSQESPNGPDEVREVFETLRRLVTKGGGDLKHLAKGTYYVADADVDREFNRLRPEFYDPASPPAASKAQVAGTGRPPRTLTIDMIAVPK